MMSHESLERCKPGCITLPGGGIKATGMINETPKEGV